MFISYIGLSGLCGEKENPPCARRCGDSSSIEKRTRMKGGCLDRQPGSFVIVITLSAFAFAFVALDEIQNLGWQHVQSLEI